MKHEYRYKSIVIPFYKNKFVVVKDTVHNEWTFVVGGCKKKENLKTCAIRELNEETRNVFKSYNENDLIYVFSFESRNRSKSEMLNDKRKGVHVTMVYNVFMIYLFEFNINNARLQYHNTKSMDNETNDIRLMTKEMLYKANMWRFMKEQVLNLL